mmetsp:Transcript_9528/g.18484  ORF Transcript_9528/g.18484 Transcript_9528/m.18484 type:complete len:193 (+) Transcript_9528:1748-2326(+)
MGNRPSHTEHRKQALIKLLSTNQLVEEVSADDATLRFGELRWTLLHLASWQGDLALAKTLLKLKFDLDAQDVHGNTALHLAQLLDHHSIYDFLIQGGADSSIQNKQGKSPPDLETLSNLSKSVISEKNMKTSVGTTTEPFHSGTITDFNPQAKPVVDPDQIEVVYSEESDSDATVRFEDSMEPMPKRPKFIE